MPVELFIEIHVSLRLFVQWEILFICNAAKSRKSFSSLQVNLRMNVNFFFPPNVELLQETHKLSFRALNQCLRRRKL